MTKKSLLIGIASLCVLYVLILSGCSHANSNAPDGEHPRNVEQSKEREQSEISNEPVTLTMYQGGSFSQEEFDRYITDPVKKKYPDITVQIIFKDNDKAHPVMLDYLIASNTDLDILFIDSAALNSLAGNAGLLYDLTDMVKSDQLDLNRFDQVALEPVKAQGNSGELYALPFSINYAALFYNVDIFDKFGTAYPRDGMNWPEVIELAKQLQIKDGDIQYRGMATGLFVRLASPLSLPSVDPETGTAQLQTDGWRKAVQLYKDIMDISPDDKGEGVRPFFQRKQIAMMPSSVNLVNDIQAQVSRGDDFNFDLASWPSYPDLPGIGPQVIVPTLMVTSTSKHKAEAFQVISYATSEDVQELAARYGRMSVLEDSKLKELFGAELPVLNGKNIQSIFKIKPAKPALISEYDSIIANELKVTLVDIVNGQVDINTGLRQAEESANKLIQEMKK